MLKRLKNLLSQRSVDYDGVGRNDECPCGSGRKFKQCCMDRVGKEVTRGARCKDLRGPQGMTQEPEVNRYLALQHGMTEEEYDRAVAALGRTPTYTELGVISVMWSEHCSYKSSRAYLGQLPTTGPRILQGAGRKRRNCRRRWWHRRRFQDGKP